MDVLDPQQSFGASCVRNLRTCRHLPTGMFECPFDGLACNLVTVIRHAEVVVTASMPCRISLEAFGLKALQAVLTSTRNSVLKTGFARSS